MVYTENFYIGFSDVSANLGIRNSAILRLFENACCLQGEAVGDGFKDSFGRWFLTAYRVKIFKRPEYNDRVDVSTWSRGTKGVAASREFEIRNNSGELCAAAISNWARLNTSTGKLERMDPEAFAKYQSEPERTNFGEMWLPKLRDIAEHTIEKKFFIDRNLIDPNRHMNNVCYLDLAERILPEEVYLRGEANDFEITYRKAIAYGETAVCEFGEDGAGYNIALKSEDGAETRAVVRLYK